MFMYTLLRAKQMNNEDLLNTTGNYTQHFAITYKGKESESEQICKCVRIYVITEQLCCTPETNNTENQP